MKLSTYFALSFALIIVIVITSVSIVYGQRTKSALEREIGESLTSLSHGMGDKLDRYMWSRYNEITLLATLDVFRQPDDLREANRLLGELQGNIPAFSWVGLLDADGNVKAATGDILVGEDISERPVYLEALKEPFVGDVHDAVLLSKLLPNPTGEPLKFVDISTPLFNDAGEFTGVLAAHLSWEWSREVQRTVLAPFQDARQRQLDVMVLSGKDHAVLSGPEEMIGQVLELPDVDHLSADNEWTVQRWPDGETYLTGFATGVGYGNYPGLGWRIVIRQPIDVAFAQVRELIVLMIATGAALAISCGLIGWMLARKVSRPLSLISEAANKLRRGEEAEIPFTRGIKDIEVLSSSLSILIAELTERKTALVRMEDKAHHDKLTGLLNRSAMDVTVQQAVRQAEERGGGLAFMYMDLDGFKAINDKYGHAVGDELLKEVADRLRTNSRGGDYLFRMGGDEFILILSVSGAEAEREAEAVAGRVLESVRLPFDIEYHRMGVSCSIGLAMWPQEGRDIDALLRDADEALYASKNKGKNQLTFAERVYA
ncbi:MAG: diguanylate cyclase [Paenibacillus sp.]|nr:diguanylate cyclase [Paenibacillus sp.]